MFRKLTPTRPGMTLTAAAALTLTLGFAGASAHAAPITINNAGFQDLFTDSTQTTPMVVGDGTSPAENQFDENEFSASFGDTQFRDREPGTSDNQWSPIFIPDWEPLGSSTATSPTGKGVINDDSDNSDMFSDTANVASVLFGTSDSITNKLTATLEAGTYQLSALVGDRTNTGFAGGDLFLQAGSTILTADSQTAPTIDENNNDGGVVTWIDTYTIGESNPLLGGTLTVGFKGGGGSGGTQTLVDDFALDFTAIPEPASLALLGLGGVMMLGRRRRGREA